MNDRNIIFVGGILIGIISGIYICRYLEKRTTSVADNYDISENVQNEDRNIHQHNDNMSIETDRPYVISPDEFGENSDYDTMSLTLYSDGVVTDNSDKPISDVDEIIGAESLNHFGEYEDDSVFVRNEKLKCDYEVLIDEREYAKVLDDKPYLKEG